VTFRPGTRGGPQAIRAASEGLEDYSPYLEQELGDCSFFDVGDLILPFGNLQASFERINELTKIIVKEGKVPFFLGGEHLLSYPVVKALKEFYSDLRIIHIDAHADLRNDYLGEAYSHATVMRRICDLVSPENRFQFGVRSGTREEFAFAASYINFYPFRVYEPFTDCYEILKGYPLYLSLDIDVLDPAYAPGTGTPEPGGIVPQEIFRLFPLLQELNIVGCDLVEVAPCHDLSGITALLAAKIVREGLITFSNNK
jgi:agmatinase